MQALFEYIFEKPEVRDLKKQLQQTLLFRNLSQKEISQVMQKINVRDFSKGQHVFFEGDLGSALYVILKGKVEIFNHNGKITPLATLSKGMFFGEVSLVDAAPRSASAIIAEDTTLVTLFKHDLEQLVQHHPRLGIKILWNLAHILGQRLRAMNERFK